MGQNIAKTVSVNGSVVKATPMDSFTIQEMVMVGNKKLLGEVIFIEGQEGTIQVYEETEGLQLGEDVVGTGRPLSLTLGPGMMSNIFDGIQRPLHRIQELSGTFMAEGIGLLSIDMQKKWDVTVLIEDGQYLEEGATYATVQESSVITHKIMVPPGHHGIVTQGKKSGYYDLETVIAVLEEPSGKQKELKLYQKWPVRKARPVKKRKAIDTLLVTGQRVLDMFFPIAKGGAAAIPGGFGTGKTMTQHQLAKWCDADIIVYIGCGERGNEMTEVLEDFPKLLDPRTQLSLMNRTILIANTSNMPVSAREASIYTGITIAEYYRDMGYHVAIMADSTSRWAEALREISGRLEEMPAEEGYPAYLPSRLAQFYERASYAKTLGGDEGSVTIIGAVSPAGGDLSEPVTENTKRFVSAFLALDKNLAYARHYPAISYLVSYSGYKEQLEEYYDEHVATDLSELRERMIQILHEDDKLSAIVQLVGEDVLPDDQRIVLSIAKVIKKGFLQQNAMHAEDTFVPLEKQYRMLKVIDHLNTVAREVERRGVPFSVINNEELIDEVIRMKYTVPNQDLSGLDELTHKIDDYFEKVSETYASVKEEVE